MRVFRSVAEILAARGEHLGTSEWVEITQRRVDTFAKATDDHQWIHVDVDRANQESPYGGPIATAISVCLSHLLWAGRSTRPRAPRWE